jgi:diguanylate cyclase (GGDEF)-like protein/PAS domain S-box-containing protein
VRSEAGSGIEWKKGQIGMPTTRQNTALSDSNALQGSLLVRNGFIQDADAAACQLFKTERLNGAPISRYLSEFNNRILAAQGESVKTGGIRQDGSFFEATVTVDHSISGTDVVRTVHIRNVRDVNDLRFEQVLLQNERDVLDLIASRAPIEKVLETLCLTMESLMPQSRCAVALRASDADELVCVASPSLPALARAAVGRIPIEEGIGTSGTAAATRKSVRVPDVATDPRWSRYHTVAAEAGVRSAWAVPFFAGDDSVVGTLSMYYSDLDHQPTELEERMVAVSVRLAEVAVESHLVRQALQHRESELRAVVNTVGAAILTLDSLGIIRDANRSAAELVGRPMGALVGSNICDLLEAATTSLGAPLQLQRGSLEGFYHSVAERRNTLICLATPQGAKRWVSVNLTPMEDACPTGKRLFVCSAIDVTEMKQSQERLAKMASHDELTGLPNRTAINDATEKAIETARRTGDSFSMLVLDLDGFKHVNDTLGHSAGDHLLKEISARMAAVVRSPDMIARRSGDEFVVLLMHADAVAAQTVARRLLSVFDTPVMLGCGQEVFASVSIGGAVYPMHGTSSTALFRNADSAMYEAKRGGRGRIVIHEAVGEAKGPTTHRIAMEAQLRRALTNNELELYYQPRVCSQTRRMVSAEALVRWNHPERGRVSPADFIPLAEDTGLIIPMGEWVLHEACRQAVRWHKAGHPEMRVSVNVSPKQFNAQFLADDVPRILAATGINPACLELEVTETAMMTVLSDDAMAALVDLRAMGVQLVLDDFGTGYSSLSYLHRFPLDGLKVDRSFVQRLPEAADARAITHAVLSMAQALNLHTVAEGVETAAQRDWLRERGCHEFQGFLYSEPVPAAELERRFGRTMSCNASTDCEEVNATKCEACEKCASGLQGIPASAPKRETTPV